MMAGRKTNIKKGSDRCETGPSMQTHQVRVLPVPLLTASLPPLLFRSWISAMSLCNSWHVYLYSSQSLPGSRRSTSASSLQYLPSCGGKDTGLGWRVKVSLLEQGHLAEISNNEAPNQVSKGSGLQIKCFLLFKMEKNSSFPLSDYKVMHAWCQRFRTY